MSLTATRLDFRIGLSHVDRGIDITESLVVAQHPSEANEHVILRVLGWCLLNEERLAFGPGLSSRGAADLWTHDLTGQLVTWVECGAADDDLVRRTMQQHAGLCAHAVFSSVDRHDTFVRSVRDWKRSPRGASLTAWLIDTSFVRTLADRVAKRQAWRVTIVSDHFYIDADGRTLDGPASRLLLTESNESE